MVSPAVGYAAAAMGYLATRPYGPMRVHELAEIIGAPPAYLSKIIHILARKGLFSTTKGKGGGVVLGTHVDPRKVTLYDLCEAMDDDIMHPKCALGTTECSDKRACPAHALQKSIRARQLEFLKKTTIQRIGDFNARRGAVATRAASSPKRPPPRPASFRTTISAKKGAKA
ncbi:MAG: RrF2 family transcriptional regulator [Phycisphaerales bacterium]